MRSSSLVADCAHLPCDGENEVRRARPLLGTVVEIRAASAQPVQQLHAAVGEAFAAVQQVHELMSYHDPGSELSRINRDAASAEQRIDAHTYAVIEAALQMAMLSDGAFDPCIGHRLEEWGYLPPTTVGGCGGRWDDVRLIAPGAVRFARSVRLDLGGIAKGYAVDRAVQVLQAAGVDKLLVNAGGDLRIAGPQQQRIGLRHPLAPHRHAAVLSLRDSALATSASYYSRRHRPGGEVSSLLDPRTGVPYLGEGSVSVCAPDCMSADALTKVVLFASPECAERALAAHGAYAQVHQYNAPALTGDVSGSRPGAPAPRQGVAHWS
jgi:thiamine biosynthesis lipoprotein